jgi:hypothetical protein
MRHPASFALLLSLLSQPPLHTAEASPPSFFYKDWEIACDNTRTCRAAGYQDDEAGAGVSVLITHAAGENQTAHIQLQLADTGSPLPSAVQMQIAGRQLGAVKLGADAKAQLSEAQSTALLAAVLKDAPVSWTAKKASWTL